QNPPVDGAFDRRTSAYSFQLPFMYPVNERDGRTIYTLTPPTLDSKPDTGVVQQFRCKALSDNDLVYRFLLCRTNVFGPNAPPNYQPRGNHAFYILSDGKEAGSNVRLSFAVVEPGIEGPVTPRTSNQPVPQLPLVVAQIGDAAPPETRLIDLLQGGF